MPSIVLQTSMSGPADNAGTCRVLYEVTGYTDVVPEIFVIKYTPPPYKGGAPIEQWQHVAYADELTDVPVTVTNPNNVCLVRKAVVQVEYTSLDKAKTAIDSIRGQIQRLMNELTTLEEFNTVQTWTISSDQQ